MTVRRLNSRIQNIFQEGLASDDFLPYTSSHVIEIPR